MHGASLGECKKEIRGTDIREEKSLSFMHKQHTVVDTLFLPHHILLFAAATSSSSSSFFSTFLTLTHYPVSKNRK
jgi:hypothetical protein